MKFWVIFLTRIRVLFSDKLFVSVMLIAPVLLSFITGYAQNKEKLGYVPIVVVNEDDSQRSELLCSRLMAKEGLRTVIMVREEAKEALREDKAEAMIVIKKGFDKKLQNGQLENSISLTKSPSSYSSEMVKEIVAMEVLRIYSGDFTYQWLHDSFKEKGFNTDSIDRQDIWKRVESYWEPKPIMSIVYEVIEAMPKDGGTITVPPYAAASLGLLVLFIMMGLLFGSGWICEEKANGTLQRTLSIKGAAIPLFLGNAAALMALGFILTIIFVTVQRVLFHVVIIKGLLAWLVVLFYIISAASLSMLMAALFKTPNQLQAITPGFAMVTGIMGGCLWNLAGVPDSLLHMAKLTPQGWALQALTNLYASPHESSFAFPAIMTLLGISGAMLLMAYLGLVKTNLSARS